MSRQVRIGKVTGCHGLQGHVKIRPAQDKPQYRRMHMLAIDDGTNNTFSSSGAPGFPVFQAGALDAWSTPILMKRGRPALTISALCPARPQSG